LTATWGNQVSPSPRPRGVIPFWILDFGLWIATLGSTTPEIASGKAASSTVIGISSQHWLARGQPPPARFRGGQNVWAPTGVLAWGCAGWSSPPAPFDRLRLRPEAQPEGAGLSSFAGAPALSLSKRGDQSRARGRSDAVYATPARMFCPRLNLPGRRVRAGCARQGESLVVPVAGTPRLSPRA